MKYSLLYILVFLIACISCNKEKPDIHSDEHDHSHEVVKLQLTEYTGQFELFAETDPFVVGETSTVLAHFTNLNDFKPLIGASVTVSLIIGSKEIKQTIETPIKPGMYKFALNPETEGVGTLLFEIKKEDVNYKIEVNDFKVYSDEHEAIHSAQELVIENANAISFTKEQSWKIDFETVLPSEKSFGKIIKTTAQILPDQMGEIVVTSKINGLVIFQKQLLSGGFINRGESLINISGSGLADNNANVRFQEAKNNYELLKSDYDRKLALSKKKIVSEKEVESAKAEFENAKAVYENLKNNFNANGQMVLSPENGVIKNVFVKNGQYVEAGEALYSIANNAKLLVRAEVQQKHYSSLGSIVSANIRSSIDNKIYGLDELNGKFLSYGKNIIEDEGFLIPVNFQIESNNRFLPGSFTEIYIKTTTNQKALVIPNTALLEEQGDFFVFVQLTPELFEKREVKVGAFDGKEIEVLSGLGIQERIVSKGAIIVKLAAVSNSLDPHAGHVH